MIADLFRDSRPATAHDLARMVGAFETDLCCLGNHPLNSREDEEAVVAELVDYYRSPRYAGPSGREMAEHVTGHYRRVCQLFASLDKFESEAIAAGLSPELAKVCRKQRIHLDLASMNIAGHEAVRRAGGRIDVNGTPGIRFECCQKDNIHRGNIVKIAPSLVSAVAALRDLPVDSDWSGSPNFTIRVYS